MNTLSSIQSAVRPYIFDGIATGAASGKSLPPGAIFYVKAPGMADSMGLSVGSYLSVPVELRSIFFIDSTTLRPVTDAYALAIVSAYLNMGEMVGRGERGVALYPDGTDSVILTKAYNYFKVIIGEEYYAIDFSGRSVFGTPDIGAYEYA